MTRRILSTMLITTLGVALAASAQTYPRNYRAADLPGAPRRGGASKLAATKDVARAMLLKRVEAVDWLEVTFEEVLDWLIAQGEDRVNVIPRWRALNEGGVERDTLVTLKIRNVNVAEVLNEILDQLSDEGNVRYLATGNTLRISTRGDFERKYMETRVYRVTDILFRIPDMGRSAPTVDLDAASRQGGTSGGGGGGQSIFAGSSGQSSEDLEEEEQEIEERLEELITIIQTHIAPESWEEGGGPGRINMFNFRMLVVTATPEVHEEIGGYFAMQ